MTSTNLFSNNIHLPRPLVYVGENHAANQECKVTLLEAFGRRPEPAGGDPCQTNAGTAEGEGKRHLRLGEPTILPESADSHARRMLITSPALPTALFGALPFPPFASLATLPDPLLYFFQLSMLAFLFGWPTESHHRNVSGRIWKFDDEKRGSRKHSLPFLLVAGKLWTCPAVTVS